MNSQRVHGRATSVLELRHRHSRRPHKSPGSSFDTAALLAAYSRCSGEPSSRESFATSASTDYSGIRYSRVIAEGRVTTEAHTEGHRRNFTESGNGQER